MLYWLAFLTVLSQGQAPASRDQRASDTQPRFELNGHVSLLADALPRRDAVEFRPRAGVEITYSARRSIRLKFDGFAEALAADRGGHGYTGEAAMQVRESWAEISGGRAELRAGFGRLVWGRLDEIQPSDVINPLDSARFLFDGRAEARLPVAFVRTRVFASENLQIEGVLVPFFRRGSFDELDESSSPFNLLSDVVLPASVTLQSAGIERQDPGRTWSNMSGGGRVAATVGRVDVASAVYRGFEGFGPVTFEITSGLPGPAVVGRLVQRFPRFTMVSGDFETVTGDWAWRGEVAVFTEKTLTLPAGAGSIGGRAIDAGVGVDRKTGDFRVFGSVILHREWSAEATVAARTDLNVVGSIERTFGNDTYLARAFAVVNPGDGSGFVRGLVVWRYRDNAAFEASAAAFVGTGDDTIARFKTRDFVLARLRWLF